MNFEGLLMPPARDYLREAAQRLDAIDPEHPGREELAETFRRVWFASADWRDWPREVRRQAQRLFPLFFHRGLIAESTATMSDVQARNAVAALRRFLEIAEGCPALRKPP